MSRGFTLVEVVVVMAVLAIVLLAGAPSLVDYIANSRVRQVTEEFQDGLALARLEAVRANQRVEFAPSATGWQVTRPASGTQDEKVLATRVTRSLENAIAVQVSHETVAFDGNGRLATGSAPFVARFTPVGGSCQASGGRVRCLNVNVTTGGNVRMCDPALAKTHPEGC